MATCSNTSSNNNENDESKRPRQPSATSIATDSHDDHDSIFQPPSSPLLTNVNSISASSSTTSSTTPPPPPPPPSSSSSLRRIPAILSYTRIKSHGRECWSSMKSSFEKVVREPARRRRRWSSSLRWSEEESSGGRRSMGSRRWNSRNGRGSWPADGEDSLFCEVLVGLMTRCGRMGVVDEGLTTTIIADDDDDDAKEGVGSDLSVPQTDLTI